MSRPETQAEMTTTRRTTTTMHATTTAPPDDRAEVAARYLADLREARSRLEALSGERAARMRTALYRSASAVLRYADDPAARREAESVIAELERRRLEIHVANVLEVVRELVPARFRDELSPDLQRRTVAELMRQRNDQRRRRAGS